MNREQIAARRAEISARLAVLASLMASENRTLTPAEVSESDTLEAEDTALAASDRFLERQEQRTLAQATPVAQRPVAATQVRRDGSAIQAPAVLTKTTQAMRNGDKWKGQSGYRLHMAKVLSAVALKKDHRVVTPEQIAAKKYPGRPDLAKILAADMAGGGVTTGEWGAELLQLNADYTGDFIEFLYATTVFDRLPFTQVPADITIKGQDAASTAYFVGESKAAPMTDASFSAVTLRRLKCVALAAISRELAERSSPDAEVLVANSLRNAIAQKVDGLAFSTTAASADVAPAGLLNGITGHASAGGTLADLYADIGTLLATFIAAKNTSGLHFISDKTVATQIGLLLSELTGLPVFPDISENGGTLHKKPYLTGDNVPAENLVMMKPSDIWVIGDSGVSMDVSTEATLEFGTAPTASGLVPTDQSENPISLWQTDQIGIKLMRDINWQYRRTSTIVTDRITNADYDGTHNTTD